MENYRPAMSFDEDTARVYDDVQRGDEKAAVAFLEQQARGGPALELAIGTGRIELPLAARGICVAGIDFSPPMVARLRAKPGGDQIAVTMGNFADVSVPGRYRLIYIVFNTLYNLLTQDEQVRCFENAAAHLTDDGLFVVEGMVPADLYRLRNNQYVDLEAVAVDNVRLDVAQHDPVNQLLVETHVTLSGAGLRLNPIVTRYVWPAELDLMARIAGLSLMERWGGWGREPFTAASGNCVSVYERRA